MRFAERNRRIGAAGLREFFEKGRRIPGAIYLSIGQADFEVPRPIQAATIEAIREGCGRYSPAEGYATVVEATRAHLVATRGLDDDEQMMRS